jgi:hypothetical protein
VQEWRKRGSANVFKDKRIGENDPTLTSEQRDLLRFQKERQVDFDFNFSTSFRLNRPFSGAKILISV